MLRAGLDRQVRNPALLLLALKARLINMQSPARAWQVGRAHYDTGNRYSPTVIAAAITSQTNKAKLPTHIALSAPDHGLPRDSVVLLEQVRTLDKRRLRERMGRVDGELMERIDAAIAVSFGLGNTQLI